MRNVALAEQLMDTIEQLRASRQRLVTAQDERAKQLERNLPTARSSRSSRSR
jgi:hypothetical protein